MNRNDVIAVYERLVARFPDLCRKGRATAYTAISGNLFSFVDRQGEMCIRLSIPDIKAYGAFYSTAPVVRYNSILRGYVTIPEELLMDEESLANWFSKSVAFAETLAPRSTTRRA